MADLTFIERSNIEKFLDMGSGYVMDFNNITFQEFIGEVIGVDIYDPKYEYASSSKANRLRAFFKIESNYNVGKLLSSFLDYWLSKVHSGEINFYDKEDLYKECRRIEERLMRNNIVEQIDAFNAKSEDKGFKLLSKQIKESIEKNEPEAALDRLHTFVVKSARLLCNTHGIAYEKDEPLNSVFGKYVKHLVSSKLIESAMTERILKSSISVLEAFNDIRNNKSFAHDNTILDYHESILIINNVSNTIKFIETIESKFNKTNVAEKQKGSADELPF